MITVHAVHTRLCYIYPALLGQGAAGGGGGREGKAGGRGEAGGGTAVPGGGEGAAGVRGGRKVQPSIMRRHYRAAWSIMERYGAVWSIMECYGVWSRVLKEVLLTYY